MQIEQELKTYILDKYLSNINSNIRYYICTDIMCKNIIYFLWVNCYITEKDLTNCYTVNYNKVLILEGLILNDYIKEKIDLFFNN